MTRPISRSLLKRLLLKRWGWMSKIYKPAAVHHKISMAKNQLMGPNEYAANGELLQRDLRENMPQGGENLCCLCSAL